jgi:hypothetical protein
MRVKTPARPSSKQEFLAMQISMEGVIDPSTKVEVFVPSLQLHVNPSSMGMSYRKNISRNRTRGGFVEEHFGDELDTVQISASTGTFFSFDSGPSTVDRHRTLAMVNFQEVLALYRNNACVYDSKGVIIAQGFVTINWDNYKFNGQFSNFTWEETAENPFRYTFNFNFEVHRTTFAL